ncbi:MAG: hypothetical protein EON93_22260 [Burkholderiales bacterium]|nr:MAG: hypothetical protein EON93_22260 [Burkholderiales bacterium]
MMWMQRFGRQLGALALLAMLVRALIPAGYMLAEAETSTGRYLVVQMCDGHGGGEQVVDLDTGKVLDGKPAPKGDTDTSKTPCMSAVSVSMSAPPATAEAVVFLKVYDADFTVATAVSPGRGIAAPPPPSTGPPVRI